MSVDRTSLEEAAHRLKRRELTKVVSFERVGRTMVKTWRAGSHRMVVGVDF